MKTIFAFVFFTAFLAPFSNTALAQTTTQKDYWEFLTLFGEPAPATPPTKEEIDSGTKSGIRFLKVSKFTADQKAIDSMQFAVSLNSTVPGKTFTDPGASSKRAEYIYDHMARTLGGRTISDPVFGIPLGLVPTTVKDPDVFMLRLYYEKAGGSIVEHTTRIPNINYALTKLSQQQKAGLTKTAFSLDYEDTTVIDQQVITVDISLLKNGGKPLAFAPNQKVTAEFWYCGGVTDTGFDGTKPAETDIKARGDKYVSWVTNYPGQTQTFSQCNGTAYYKIGETTFTPPESFVAAQTQATEADAASANFGIQKVSAGETLPSCGVVTGSIMGCVAQILYYAIFLPISFIAGLLGNIFDFFLGYSLSDQSYRHDFIQSSWQLVRDISNIFFIILMIWSGLAVVFGIGKVSYKQVVPALIINALLINFSLFATRVVVDISNITARLFYNQMTVRVDGQIRDIGISGFKPISESIVSAFNPQRIFENSSVLSGEIIVDDAADQQNNNPGTANFNAGQNVYAKTDGLTRGSREYASYFALVTLMAALIMWGVAMMFWKTAFIFVGRVIGIYISMIFSPVAFLSRGGVPLIGSLPFSWGKWWGNLSDYAIVAPIFLFFLYIINAFLGVKFFSALGIAQADGLFGTLMYILIPMLIIYGLMDQATGVAKRFAGEIGNKVQEFATKTTGIVGGAALMATGAGVARLGVGLGARAGKIIGNTRVGKWAASNAENSALARRVSNTLDWTQKSSWDPRKTKIGGMLKDNALFKGMGVDLNKGMTLATTAGLGEKQFEGGAIERAKRKAEKEEKDRIAKISGYSYLTKENAQAVWADKSDENIGKDATKNYLDKTDAEFKAQSDEIKVNKKEVEDLKKKVSEAEANLRTQNKLSDDEKTKIETELKINRDSIQDKEDSIKKTQGLQLQSIEKLRSDKSKEKEVRESKEYKEAYKDALDANNKKFGKVESGKDLENAMRRMYFENIRDNSIWMQDGKQRGWLPASGTMPGMLTGLLSSFGLLGTMSTIGVASGLFADAIKSEQEAVDTATGSFLKNYDKTKKTNNQLELYKQKLKDMNEAIKQGLADYESAVSNTAVSKDDIDLDKIDIKEQEAKIKSRVEDMQAEMALREEDYKKVADEYRKGVGDPNLVKEAAREKQKAKDAFEELKNIWENRRKTEENIEKTQSN